MQLFGSCQSSTQANLMSLTKRDVENGARENKTIGYSSKPDISFAENFAYHFYTVGRYWGVESLGPQLIQPGCIWEEFPGFGKRGNVLGWKPTHWPEQYSGAGARKLQSAGLRALKSLLDLLLHLEVELNVLLYWRNGYSNFLCGEWRWLIAKRDLERRETSNFAAQLCACSTQASWTLLVAGLEAVIQHKEVYNTWVACSHCPIRFENGSQSEAYWVAESKSPFRPKQWFKKLRYSSKMCTYDLWLVFVFTIMYFFNVILSKRIIHDFFLDSSYISFITWQRLNGVVTVLRL